MRSFVFTLHCSAVLLCCAAASILAAPAESPLAEDGISLQCAACKMITKELDVLWGSQIFQECLPDFATYICQHLNLGDHFICKGVISNFKDEFIYILGQILTKPSEICGLLIENCFSGGVNPLNSTWSIPIPGNKPPRKANQPPPIGTKPTLKVLHLTDLHVDYKYAVGTEGDCPEPICCRFPGDYSEIKLASGIKQPAGPWGTIGNCDTPYWTVVNLLQHISKAHKDIDYIVVSGDLGSHTIWNYTRDANQFVVRNISAAFQQFLPGVKTYFAIGNHEPAPADNVAVHNVPDKFLSDWLYDTMADSWKSWLPSDQLEVIKYRGSFVVQLYPGLRLISHNTLLGDDNNFFLYINQTDPDGYMTWLANELAKAEAAGDKVQIVGHIPPSEGDTFAAWTTNYLNVINRFEDTIVGQFMGHTHTEQYYLTFEKIDDARTRPTSVIFSSPSVTPYGSCNPAYRIYTVDGNYPGSTYKLLDWEEWFLNLTVANANPSVAEWTNLYTSVRAEYGMKSLEPADWKDLEDRMHTDDPLYRKYWRNFHRVDGFGCDANCKKSELCLILEWHTEECQKFAASQSYRKPKLYSKRTDHVNIDLDIIRESVKRFSKDKCPFANGL